MIITAVVAAHTQGAASVNIAQYTLQVEAVPVPVALWMFAPVIALIAAARRRAAS